ncbi:MAG: nucleotide exchange factor GrpE [Longimicrobiales bacterium]|nr:nucleotide exchange factor GrpE [Longimicrobiales bacterium]
MTQHDSARSSSPGSSRVDDPEGDLRENPESPEAEEERQAEEELRRELDHLEEEFEGLKDRHLRLAADFENYRRRAENEMTESWVRAQADLVRRLLDALDDLQRVSDLDPEETTVGAVVEGVELVERKLLQAMKEAGVEVLEPEGEVFDPEVMEAMMRVPAESEEDDDRVDQVFQKGYTFKGHLVRPARVSVLKHD